VRVVSLVRDHGGSFLAHATPRKVLNAARVQAQMRTGRTLNVGYPYEIIIDPNNRCNLRCPLCPTGQRRAERPPGEMPLLDFRRLLDEMGPYLFKIRFYNWGEPLLYGSIHHMVSMARERNVGTQISSNLSFPMAPGDADRLIRSGLEKLKVSLDGTTPETYRIYRRGGDFQQVVENVEQLARRKKALGSRTPVIEIQFLVMRHNEHEVSALDSMRARIGANRARTSPVVINILDPEQRRAWLPANSALSRYDHQRLEDRIFRSDPGCRWPWTSAVVNWDGTVSPCCVFEGPKTEMGNAFDPGGFRAVWNGPAYGRARSALQGGNRPVQSDDRPHPGREAYRGHELCAGCRGTPRAGNASQQGLY